MGQKSIIGCGYVPRGARAMCLKTNRETILGGTTHSGTAKYTIISDPYERELIKTMRNPLSLSGEARIRYKAMAVNVLDPLTGLTYAVEYHPANLVRKDAESPQAAVSKSPKMDSATYIEKINSYAKALDKIVKDNPEVANGCGVLLIFNRIDEGGMTCTGVSLFDGNSHALQVGLEKACRENPEFYPFLAEVVKDLASGRTYDLTLCLGGIVCGERNE